MGKLYDVVIIGGGPAGLSAAIYMARARYHVLVVEKEKIGGQITITSEVVNYPGIAKTDGTHLTESMKLQAMRFGAEFLIAEVTDVELKPEKKIIITNKGEMESYGIILATGANPRNLGFEGEEKFKGKGVAYCATCDGEFFTGLDVFVIGGGFAAAEESIFLTKYAKKVIIIVREDDFTCAKSIADEVKNNKNIEVHYNTEIVEASGSQLLEKAVFHNNRTNETWEYHAKEKSTFGIFVFAGYVPATELVKGKILLDDQGYIITDSRQKTNIDGVYGAGDVCIKDLRQVVTAVSDGAIGATSLEKYISSIYKKNNISKEKHTNIKTQNENNPVDYEFQEDSGHFVSREIRAQLAPVFAKFEKQILLKGYLDERPVSKELEGFLDEMGQLTEKITCKVIHKKNNKQVMEYPSLWICDEEEAYLGVQFHGIPGGHEFNSFIISLYNAAGPGQAIEQAELELIRKISQTISLKIAISLSCTMCPDLVMAASRIALENSNIETEVFDIAHFPELKEKYQIMSVPCIVINDEYVYFGKKNIPQLIQLINHITKGEDVNVSR